MARVLEGHGLTIALKWPNDVLMLAAENEKRKLAGILLELGGDAEGPCDVVAGIGLNVALPESLSDRLDQPVAAVREQAPDVSRNGLAAELIDAVLGLMAGFERAGFAAWQEEWNQRNAYAGQEVEVIQSTHRYLAVDAGVDEAGNLRVQCGGKQLRLIGGEISLRGRAHDS